MNLALTAAGFILLVWHRETNEISQRIWEAAVTTGMDETGMERLDSLFKGMHIVWPVKLVTVLLCRA